MTSPRLVHRSVALAAIVALALAFAPRALAVVADKSTPAVISAYSLAAPRSEVASGLVARAVVPGGTRCPTLRITGRADRPDRFVPMTVRPTPARTSPAFDAITVCTAPLPVGATKASISGVVIPAAMPTSLERLAMLGDSGCRIASWQVQDCASETAWPLAVISQSVADERPDAVLFNGDFFYREAACPAASQAMCGASPPPIGGLPFTDSAYGWIADALLPMAPMLAAAPLIVTRGNHEACYRGGNGFFLLFDPREGTHDTCAPVPTAAGLVAADTLPTPTYAIDVAVRDGRTLRLAIVDSAGGSDNTVTSFAAIQRPAYARAADLAQARTGRETWLVTHRPLYGFVTTAFAQPGQPFNPWGSMDQAAAADGLLGNYDLVFSSHMHIAQSVQLPGLPGQLILGNAGTLLDPATGYPLPTSGPQISATQGYPAPMWGWVGVRFGYAMASPQADRGSWRIAMKDPNGATFARCGLAQRTLYCRDRT